MNTKLFVLPAICLGSAAALLVPAPSTQAFSKIGGQLGENQRDVRVFDNFADTQANNNNTPSAQFPGWLGVELAVWKGIVEWGSLLHGDGSGDPLGGNQLGSGGANFDAMWAGNSSAVGTTNQNIVSALASCGGGGTLAFTETPISDGWKIRFCDSWVWDDGPGSISNRWDIQGVMCHEYGHALGLGHSGSNGATMFPSGSPGQTNIRSINFDDSAGVQCIYGVASGTKPVIVATAAGGGNLTIYGSDFGATGNEVWFTNANVTANNVDPIVRVTNVSSSAGNTVITVAIPGDASPGDVIVNKSPSGNTTVSNAFPTDLVGTFGDVPGTHPMITNVSPSSIDALIPGTAETITITGTDLDLTTDVLLDGGAIDSARYTIVNPTTITLDMPQASSLGSHDLGVTDGGSTDEFAVTIAANSSITYELGNGDALNVVDRSDGLDYIVAGAPGTTHRVAASISDLPSVLPGTIDLAIGNNFSMLFTGLDHVIPAKGWDSIFIPTGALVDPGPGGQTYYSQTVQLGGAPFPTSNLQSMILVQ